LLSLFILRHQFVTVEFDQVDEFEDETEEKVLEAEVASTAWLLENQKSVYWPRYRSIEVFQKLLKSHADPKTAKTKLQWDILNCRVVGIPQGNELILSHS
jgi:hypothetical protein